LHLGLNNATRCFRGCQAAARIRPAHALRGGNPYCARAYMMETDFYVLVAIFVLVVVALLGFSFVGAPQYPAGYPKDRMTTSK
jgi:hypothetical protein